MNVLHLPIAAALAVACLGLPDTARAASPAKPESIKSYCLAHWNRMDATKVVPEAIKAKVGLYGFTKPRTDSGLVPLEPILSRPVHELRGDDRNIATLARAFHGVPVEATWTPQDGFTR
ncbi:MAG: hypothetical protein ACO3JG_11845 [Luteolibacter sp.]